MVVKAYYLRPKNDVNGRTRAAKQGLCSGNQPNCRTTKDISAPDVYTNSQIMVGMIDE